MTAVPRPPRLPPDELAAALSGLPLWSGDGEGIRRSVELPDFPDAVAALVRMAFVAEQLDHHPDVDLRWRTLHLTLVTHSAGGVTELDLELARRIDALFPG
ncbi:4a-hydroxytetrahydrobiopterin dehydratase [Geodermatophilus obscurus]|uniref:Putative pterin-4-alpha-carbinolamine dehydratase n=1 Tax=Geodermatophilus obscurus (strain ATCC 25078 / DSM 43160 / JCM 3152 / CCUG 61914 / KCC A-0152 / KCTC 9177 / NBRC 13315 / NRRL B-3577 / G-20) TaxID=526225 RepID=D2S9W7_GEOOG|nr:transcriptional coactivator/pterin dehydratase [Geodermatophilus obscurus DSM 43160]